VQNTLGVVSGLRTRVLKRGRSSKREVALHRVLLENSRPVMITIMLKDGRGICGERNKKKAWVTVHQLE
jgi:hypothetical protein